MTQATVTLNRAHKVVERLKAELSRLQTLIGEKTSPVNVNLPLPSSQADRLEADSDSFMQDYNKYMTLLLDAEQAKVAIAKSNHELNANALLAEMDSLNKELVLIKSISSKAEYARNLPTVREACLMDPGQDRMGRSAMAQVTRVSQAQTEWAEKRAEEIQKQIHKKADSLADLNREKVTLTLSELGADVAGLV